MNLKSRVASVGSGNDDSFGGAQIEESSTHHSKKPNEELSDAESNPKAIDRPPVGRNFFLRKQLSNKRKKLLASRTRAQDMIARFELSETKCTDLFKMAPDTNTIGCNRAVAVTGAPQFTVALSTKQAMKAFSQKGTAKGMKPSSSTDDPLLTERERKVLEKQLEIEQRKRCIHSRLSPASQLTTEPVVAARARDPLTKSKEAESSKHHRMDAIKTTPWLVKGVNRTKPAIAVPTSKLGGKGMLNIAPVSPSSYSVAPTEANTPSPRLQSTLEFIDGSSTVRPRFHPPLHSLC